MELRIACHFGSPRNQFATYGPSLVVVVSLLVLAVGMILSATHFAGSTAPPEKNTAAAVAEPAMNPDDPQLAGHFQGTVFDTDGKPIAHAQIYVARFVPTLKSIGAVRAETDADGHFAFDAPDMTYIAADGLPARREGLLIATADGFAADWMQTWGRDSHSGAHWDPVPEADARLYLVKNDVPIHGRFLDPDGKPLAGARVRIENVMIPWKRDLNQAIAKLQNMFIVQDYERPVHCADLLPGLTPETRTDADGRFTLSGIGGERLVELLVTSPSIIDSRVMVMTRAAPDVGIRLGANRKPTDFVHGANFTRQLERGATLQGVVRDRDTHVPIPGMWISRNGNPLLDPEAADHAVLSDEQGRFTITSVHPLTFSPRREDLFEVTGENSATMKWTHQALFVMAYPQPGDKYVTAQGSVEFDGHVVIECVRGIPFHLKLIEERGEPVAATVEYWPVSPNTQVPNGWNAEPYMCRAARREDGRYEGFVLPGPGAVVVQKPDNSYRSAHVDPKEFFEPGRTDWSDRERFHYGTKDTLAIGQGWDDQHRYAAIVLVNPKSGDGPLELSATVKKAQPRSVTLLDPDGQPVMGATTQGMTFDPWDDEPTLRASSFLVTDLTPDRPRRITFIQEERKLIGELLALGDDTTPYTVQMQPWGTVTGHLLDEDGERLSGNLIACLNVVRAAPATDAEVSEWDHEQLMYVETNDGRFRIEKLIAGVR